MSGRPSAGCHWTLARLETARETHRRLFAPRISPFCPWVRLAALRRRDGHRHPRRAACRKSLLHPAFRQACRQRTCQPAGHRKACPSACRHIPPPAGFARPLGTLLAVNALAQGRSSPSALGCAHRTVCRPRDDRLAGRARAFALRPVSTWRTVTLGQSLLRRSPKARSPRGASPEQLSARNGLARDVHRLRRGLPGHAWLSPGLFTTGEIGFAAGRRVGDRTSEPAGHRRPIAGTVAKRLIAPGGRSHCRRSPLTVAVGACGRSRRPFPRDVAARDPFALGIVDAMTRTRDRYRADQTVFTRPRFDEPYFKGFKALIAAFRRWRAPGAIQTLALRRGVNGRAPTGRRPCDHLHTQAIRAAIVARCRGGQGRARACRRACRA